MPEHIPEHITVKCITWNMGNTEASPNAITHYSNYLQNADIIAIATQEEFAADGSRFDEKLLAQLNANLAPEHQYKLMGYQAHSTSAGGKVSAKNRVASAVLVKPPYQFTDVETTIIYDENSKKRFFVFGNYNKSAINISGKIINQNLPADQQAAIPISITGAHFDAFSDLQRRKHARKYLDDRKLSTQHKNIDELYQTAAHFNLVMGDFNERFQLMADHSVRDPMADFVLAWYGFDIAAKPTITGSPRLNDVNDNNPLDGTYGFVINSLGEAANVPDKRAREHNASRGYLDRIACVTGLPLETEQYLVPVSAKHLTDKKGTSIVVKHNAEQMVDKIRHFGSDHLAVIRSFKINVANMHKSSIIGNYLHRLLPDMKQQIAALESLKNELLNYSQTHPAQYQFNEQEPELLAIANPLRFYDSKISPRLALNAAIGANMACKNLKFMINHINSQLATLHKAQTATTKIRLAIYQICNADPNLELQKNSAYLLLIYDNFIKAINSKAKTIIELKSAVAGKEQLNQIEEFKLAASIKSTEQEFYKNIIALNASLPAHQARQSHNSNGIANVVKLTANRKKHKKSKVNTTAPLIITPNIMAPKAPTAPSSPSQQHQLITPSNQAQGASTVSTVLTTTNFNITSSDQSLIREIFTALSADQVLPCTAATNQSPATIKVDPTGKGSGSLHYYQSSPKRVIANKVAIIEKNSQETGISATFTNAATADHVTAIVGNLITKANNAYNNMSNKILQKLPNLTDTELTDQQLQLVPTISKNAYADFSAQEIQQISAMLQELLANVAQYPKLKLTNFTTAQDWQDLQAAINRVLTHAGSVSMVNNGILVKNFVENNALNLAQLKLACEPPGSKPRLI